MASLRTCVIDFYVLRLLFDWGWGGGLQNLLGTVVTVCKLVNESNSLQYHYTYTYNYTLNIENHTFEKYVNVYIKLFLS